MRDRSLVSLDRLLYEDVAWNFVGSVVGRRLHGFRTRDVCCSLVRADIVPVLGAFPLEHTNSYRFCFLAT